MTLINFWAAEIAPIDPKVHNTLVEILKILSKSAYFCEKFAAPGFVSCILGLSKVSFVSQSQKEKIIQITSYLAARKFTDSFQPIPIAKTQVVLVKPPS